MIDKHIYTNIQEKHITLPGGKGPFICYSITFIEKCDYMLFGKVIKHNEKVKELPFLFKSIEIAKDFCELMPTYKKIMKSNREYSEHLHYYTYALYNNTNEKIAELYWDKNFIKVEQKNDDNYYTGDVISTPLIDKFVYRLYIPNSYQLNKYANYKDAIGWEWCASNKLSDLIQETMPIINNTENLYTYEMIQK